MTKVILDSNFLMVPLQLGIDVISELKELLGKVEIYTLDVCLNELKAKGMNLRFIPEVEVIRTQGGKADGLLVEYGVKGFMIATNDKDLRKKLKEKNIRVAFIRNMRYLEIE